MMLTNREFCYIVLVYCIFVYNYSENDFIAQIKLKKTRVVNLSSDYKNFDKYKYKELNL